MPRPWQHTEPLLGPADPSFRALSGRLKCTVRRHEFNQDSLYRKPDAKAVAEQHKEVVVDVAVVVAVVVVVVQPCSPQPSQAC